MKFNIFLDDIAGSPGLIRVFMIPFGIIFVQKPTAEEQHPSSSSRRNIINDFGNIYMKFGNEFLANSFLGIHKTKFFLYGTKRKTASQDFECKQ
jgi:hypothetical protein